MAYDLIKTNIITTPAEIVKDMSWEDCLIFLDMMNLLEKDGVKLMRNKVFGSMGERVVYPLNGKKRLVTIVRGGETSTTKPVLNQEKTRANAVKFAKKNNLHIPYKEPEIDFEKMENELWYQQNIDKFVVKENKTITRKSNDAIRGKYVE